MKLNLQQIVDALRDSQSDARKWWCEYFAQDVETWAKWSFDRLPKRLRRNKVETLGDLEGESWIVVSKIANIVAAGGPGDDSNIHGYVATAVRNALGEHAEQLDEYTNHETTIDDDYNEDGESFWDRQPDPDSECHESHEPSELLGMIDKICRTDGDRRIVEEKLGWVETDTSPRTINDRFKKLGERYQQSIRQETPPLRTLA